MRWFETLAIGFSFRKNFDQLTAPTKAVGVDLRCMNGMRTLSICWIILGHTLLWSTQIGFRNVEYFVQETTSLAGIFYTFG